MYYFIPNAKSISRKLFAQHGIDSLIESPQGRETFRGPDGGNGMIYCSTTMPTDGLTFDTSTQIWEKRFGSEVYIGRLKDKPATSLQLQRPALVPGQSLKLLDGNDWIVPRLRMFDENQLDGPIQYAPCLDQTLQQDPETGRMVAGEVVPQHRDIWNRALTIGDRLLAQLNGKKCDASIEDGELDDFACDCLAMNYHVGKPELSMLGVLTMQLSTRVLQLAIDWDTLRANLGNRLRRRVSGGINTEFGATHPTEG